jgi:hypothetical protein
MPCVETKIVINGDSKPIFEIIKNMEAYPSFMHDLVSVEILERGENNGSCFFINSFSKIIYIPIFYMCKIIQQRFKRISKQISASSCQRTKSFSVKRIPCRNKLFPFCSQSRNLQASLNSFCTAAG